MKRRAYIAFGSNLGDRHATLSAAAAELKKLLGVVVQGQSDAVETEPVGGPAGQGKYLNAVFEIDTTLGPKELLAALQHIERDLGRDREKEPRWGPRTCDLDILLMGDLVAHAPELTIPHPRMHERLFVLGPLAQIAPNAVHPVLHRTVAELLSQLERQR